jgi:hypothetical protein
MMTASSASQSTCFENAGRRTSAPVPMTPLRAFFRKNQGSAPLLIDGRLPVVRSAMSAISLRWSQ